MTGSEKRSEWSLAAAVLACAAVLAVSCAKRAEAPALTRAPGRDALEETRTRRAAAAKAEMPETPAAAPAEAARMPEPTAEAGLEEAERVLVRSLGPDDEAPPEAPALAAEDSAIVTMAVPSEEALAAAAQAREEALSRARAALEAGDLDEAVAAMDTAGAASGGEGAARMMSRRGRAPEKKKGAAKPRAPKVTTWRRARAVPNTSRLMIGDKEELPLKGMQVKVQLDGFRARVLIDCYYLNDRNRRYEGTFKLRLPNEASPYFFAFGETAYEALDPAFYSDEEARAMGIEPDEIMSDRKKTWKAPREARMVPKEKAAFAYHETVRRRIDPALMEWSGAGVFSARVFPLVPGKLHRIVIGYDVDLTHVGDDLEYRLDLPEGVPSCVVDLSVAGLRGAPAGVTPEAEPFVADDRAYYRFQDPAKRTIVVRFKDPGAVMLTGTDEKTGTYFAARFRPELPEAAASAGAPFAVFMVDVSLSSNPEKFNVWLKLMEAILEKNRDSLRQFMVLFFNVESFWWRSEFVENTPENVAAAIEFADGLVLEGATDLEAALRRVAFNSRARAEEMPPWDLFLLSDGSPTWGEGDLSTLSAALEEANVNGVFAYTTGLAGTDTRVLTRLARETGGGVFFAAGEAEVAWASTAHRSRPWRIAAVTLEGGTDLLLAGRPRSLFPGQNLLLVGRGTPVAGEVALSLKQGGAEKVVTTKLIHVLRSDLAPRVYGQVATNQLEELKAATEDFSRAYACHFRVTGQTCSLLMLESEADYRRYNIRPEEDAFVVKKNPVSKVLAKILDEIAGALGDAKTAFLAWLRKMDKMPGFQFNVPTALRMALESMPKESFSIVPRPLACRLRSWDDVPGNVKEALVSRKLDYDGMNAEASRRLKEANPADALKALSSLVEQNPGDSVLARDVGFSAMEWGLGGQAYHLFRRVAGARPYEPQTYHAMARCLEEMKRADLALAYYEVGLAGKWAGRFGDFRSILGLDYLRLLRLIEAEKLETSAPDFASARLKTVAKEFGVGEADLVIIITWNTDATDIDLHVIEPTREECYYRHRKTRIGGRITQDVTQGYGPEMYTLKKAVPGKYRIRVNYFAQTRTRAGTRTKVYATVYERMGTPSEKVTRKVVTLVKGKEMRDIATVVVGK